MKVQFRNAQNQKIQEMEIFTAARNIRREQNTTRYTLVIKMDRDLLEIFQAIQAAKTLQILDGNRVLLEVDLADKEVQVEEEYVGSNSVLVFINMAPSGDQQ